MNNVFVLIIVLFLIPLVLAGSVKIGVKMSIKGNISAVFYNVSNGFLTVNQEFFNSGSVAYKTRIRLDVLNSTDVMFTGWSKEETIMPGERKNFEIDWYTPKTENVVVRLIAYYGKEMTQREMKLKIENNQTSEDVIQIKNFRTYDDSVKFQIRSTTPLSNVIIIPENYMMGWVFEQKKIENLNANKNIEVTIPYEPSVWLTHDLNIAAVTEDGRYYSIFLFNLKKEEGFQKYTNYILDKIDLFLNL